jgi:hypothetical protein
MTLDEPPKRLRIWSDWDHARLERDRAEIEGFSANLKYVEPYTPGFPYGGYHGTLPMWPFNRAVPDGLRELLLKPIELHLLFASAHPMVPPTIVPIYPQPLMQEESLSRWHVLPGGALCLLQSEGMWIPEASVVELLLKACGWHIEYALMSAGAIDEMAVAGIVSDDSQDHLIVHALGNRESEEA